MRQLLLSPFLVLCCVACADVPEHELRAVLDYDGKHFEGVIRFPDHDDEFSGGDDSCSFTTGNCPTRSKTRGELVSGDLPFAGANLEGNDDFVTYDVFLHLSPDDPGPRGAAWGPRDTMSCRVYESQLGEPDRCFGTDKPAMLTLTKL
jgi:hypothetical protein